MLAVSAVLRGGLKHVRRSDIWHDICRYNTVLEPRRCFEGFDDFQVREVCHTTFNSMNCSEKRPMRNAPHPVYRPIFPSGSTRKEHFEYVKEPLCWLAIIQMGDRTEAYFEVSQLVHPPLAFPASATPACTASCAILSSIPPLTPLLSNSLSFPLLFSSTASNILPPPL